MNGQCKDCKWWTEEGRRSGKFVYGKCKSPVVSPGGLVSDPRIAMIEVHDPYVGWDCRSDFGCNFFEDKNNE